MVLHPEVLVAVGNAVFLLSISFGLDPVALLSHVSSERYRTAGFSYQPTRATPGSVRRAKSS